VQEDVREVSDTPSPEPTADMAAGLNRAADIGADSFHLASGKGGGLFGRGGGGGTWDAFVATHVRRALRADPRTSTASGYLEVLFAIDPNGRFERAELQSSTGNKELDAAIRDVLSRLPPLSRGRPANVKPLMVTGINIRATQD
jgi:TonB family protein